MQRVAAVLGSFAAAVVIAACAATPAGPERPLMSPAEEAGGVGYAERRLAERRFEVSYLTPTRAVLRHRAGREQGRREAEQLARDMAVWRAAQLALEHGYPAFQVTDSGSDVEVVDRYPFSTGPYNEYYFSPYTLSFEVVPDDYVQVWARATVIVTFNDGTVAGAFDAAATARRLAETYPEALGPPREN